MLLRRKHSCRATVAALIAVLALAACKDQPKAPAAPPPEVTVMTVAPHATPLVMDLVSEVKAFREVELRPRVTGVVIKQNFRPGQKVKEGDLLFAIDPREYDEAVLDARANLAEAEAVLARARQDVTRYEPLLPDNAIPRQTYDQAVAAAQQNAAIVQARKAALEKARLDRSYAEVRSPVSGQIGLQQIEVGALASSGQTVLATVSTLDPVVVYFSIPEIDYVQFSRRYGGDRDTSPPPPIELMLADGSAYDQPGRIDFADRALNPGTGTLTVRAVFPNPHRVLLPGMNTRVRMTYEVAQNALLIPQKAVTELLGKYFATVVGAGNKTDLRPIRPGARIGDMWLIEDGLKAGDRIVVDGLQKAKAGTVITPLPLPAPAAPAPAAPAAAKP